MGDINFVNNPEQKKPVGKKRKETPGVEWSQPDAEDGLTEFSGKKPSAEDAKKEGTLEHDRAKVAQAIAEEKRKNKPDKDTSPGFFDFIIGLFSRGKKETGEKNKYKKEKEVLAEQASAVMKEKKVRQNGKDRPDQAGEVSGETKTKTKAKSVDNRINYSEAKRVSISDVIKMKLKLDKLGGGSEALKTNLIKDEITTYVDWKKNMSDLTLNILLSILIVGIAYGALMYREHRAIQQEQGIDQQIKSLKEDLDQDMKNVKEIDRFQKKLGLVAGILKEHIYWTNFFAFLEKTILEDVTYTGGNFSGKPDGTYTFSATADSFRTAEDQVRVLRNNELVKSASVKSVSFNATDEDSGINIPTVNFSIKFEVDTKLFTLSKEEFEQYFDN